MSIEHLKAKVQPLAKSQEAALYRKMRRGDLAARDALLASVLPWILNRVQKLAPAHEDFDDNVSLAILHMLSVLPKFRPARGRLTTFVATCLYRFFSKRRETSRRVMYFLGDDLPDVADEEAVDGERGWRQRQEVVQAEVANLPEREREIVSRRLRGDTLQAIGTVIGVSKERVRQIETTAHQRLRIALRRHNAVQEFLQ